MNVEPLIYIEKDGVRMNVPLSSLTHTPEWEINIEPEVILTWEDGSVKKNVKLHGHVVFKDIYRDHTGDIVKQGAHVYVFDPPVLQSSQGELI